MFLGQCWLNFIQMALADRLAKQAKLKTRSAGGAECLQTLPSKLWPSAPTLWQPPHAQPLRASELLDDHGVLTNPNSVRRCSIAVVWATLSRGMMRHGQFGNC
jgi:hypothetical protein